MNLIHSFWLIEGTIVKENQAVDLRIISSNQAIFDKLVAWMNEMGLIRL